ncbi:MAG: hypothetical protein ACI8TS_001654 [Flavobacteriales bacterium]|jgi:hypothetical protein
MKQLHHCAGYFIDKMKIILTILPLCLLLFSCTSQSQEEVSFKFNGLSFVGNPKPVGEEAFSKVSAINANAITLMPFAYGNSNQGSLTYENLDWQWWGESPEGVESCIQQAKQNDLKVIIKPQIWFNSGTFTGHHRCETEADWKSFEEDYTRFIMIYAELSAKYDLPAFCIGTELCTFAETRQEFWKGLIQEVRSVYNGKLTYAANWDSYTRVPFWGELDYVGIDAYFPLSDAKSPVKEDLIKAWGPICDQLEAFSNDLGIQVIFMEWGYRSTDYCAKTPWETGEGNAVNLNSQAQAIAAVFEGVWHKPWYAGGFIWKWFPNGSRGGSDDNRFTPQNKPAEEVISNYFEQFK